MNHSLPAKIINHIFPSSCPSCGSETDTIAHAPFCRNCWAAIKRYTGPACRICAAPLSSEYSGICSDCIRNAPAFSKAIAFGIYEGVLADAIHFYKFRGIRRLHAPLGRFLLSFDMTGIDALIPVPLSVKGLRERGFNQSLLLARIISLKKGVPLIMNGLTKRMDTSPQVGLSAARRASNIKGAFSAVCEFRDMSLMLVDDVMTTGATVRECAKELLKEGAREVSVLALARAAAT
jgi:ComF family protein